MLNKLEEGFVMAGFAVMGLVLALQIFMRYVVNRPLVWSEEFARYLFVWVTFIGAGYGVRHKIHISMEVFFVRLPKALRIGVAIATNLLSIAVFAYLIPWGIRFIEDQNEILSSAMGIPMSWVFVSVPIGCLIVCLRLAGDTVRVVRTKGENL